MNIYTNSFISIELVENNTILKAIWDENSEKMDEKDFRAINLKYLELIELHQIQKFLINAQKFDFPIVPETQTWVAENIIAKTVDLGLKKLAFLVSAEMIAQLSIEQTMDEQKEKAFDLQYFDNEVLAITWLNK